MLRTANSYMPNKVKSSLWEPFLSVRVALLPGHLFHHSSHCQGCFNVAAGVLCSALVSLSQQSLIGTKLFLAKNLGIVAEGCLGLGGLLCYATPHSELQYGSLMRSHHELLICFLCF